ncbi:DUF3592 domain-containing protein [Maribacter thermophilus]|uniref:DUF3592 domain-containing protein n=1 Tax=Maribacter thermophilus TaxID=1197874 RepID=UPI000640F65B|nr:DUF3592 domain-containing protein [Maribacter thermophilus]
MKHLIKALYFLTLTILFLFLVLQVVLSCYSFYKPLQRILENNRFLWEKRVANIELVELDNRPNPDMPKETSMVFPINECKIKYAYEYNGKHYSNMQIGLNTKKEYDSKFHTELYGKLKEMNTVAVYVNPENPGQSSILKYDLDLKDIGAGIALLIFPLLLGYWIYIGKKHPANYLADQIKTLS